ncbi:MAG: alpha/beta hydrolase [Rubripirellula sp.]
MYNTRMLLAVLATTLALSHHVGAVEKHNWTLGYTPDKSIRFHDPIKGAALKLDLFLPDGHEPAQKRACIVFFFGGGWTGGNTEQFYGYAKYFASRGIVAISAQYRTKASHQATPDQCVHDGKEAIRYVRRHASELGIDSDKIIAGGGSAGGHVAAAVAMCPKIDASPNDAVSCMPNALVLFNPVYDNGPGGYGHARVKDYWKDISPLHNIRAGLPPAIVFFGSVDKHVRVATVNAFQKQMRDAGNDCESHIYDGRAHGFFHISKGGRAAFEDVLGKTDAFLREHAFLSGKDTVADWTAMSIANKTNK